MSSFDDILQHSPGSDVTITTISRSTSSTGDGKVLSWDVKSPRCVARSAPQCIDDLLDSELKQTAVEHPANAAGADADADGDDFIACSTFLL